MVGAILATQETSIDRVVFVVRDMPAMTAFADAISDAASLP
jgi:hypothetical protein